MIRRARPTRRQVYNCSLLIPPLEHDPRFAAALAHMEAGDWLEASDAFEELYFEATGRELPIVRVMLQLSTGFHHISRGQRRAAAERLGEALRAMDDVQDAYGVDLEAWRARARQCL